MTETITIQDKAREALEYLSTATRDDGSIFVHTVGDVPEWVTTLLYEAHGGFMPDDHKYSLIFDALVHISDSDDPEDDHSEFADNAVDVYTMAKFRWLASDLRRQGYVDDAVSEFGLEYDGLDRLIGMGQYMEANEVYGSVLRSLETQVEEGVA